MVFYVDYEEFIRGTSYQNTANARGLAIPARPNEFVKAADDGDSCSKQQSNGCAPARSSSSSVFKIPGPAAAVVPSCDVPMEPQSEPSSWVEVAGKVSSTLVFALGFLFLSPFVGIEHLKG
jgi:hypothetical protein